MIPIKGKVSAYLAWRWRQRGLTLPDNQEYANPRLLEIAKRQKELLTEHDKLDKEIYELFKSENS